MNLIKILSLFVVGLFVLSCMNVVSASIPENIQNNDANNLLDIIIKPHDNILIRNNDILIKPSDNVIITNVIIEGIIRNRDDKYINNACYMVCSQ